MNPPKTKNSNEFPNLGFGEFVGLIAAIMALNALAIDTMLPALPAIGQSLKIVEPNQRQWIISAYLIGFASLQIAYGPVSDRFGRRRILLACLAAYAIFSFIAGIADSFTTMIIARMLQGAAAAGTRVLAVAIVRDRFSGAQMARVMSLTFIVFLTVPILAPSIGQLILNIAPWRDIFYLLAICSLFVLGFSYFRLSETLHPEFRRPISVSGLRQAFYTVLTDRISVGYTLASTFILGGLFGFINSVQQIYTDVFHAPRRFPFMFSAVAGTMAVAALLNSRIVERVGMRRVSHGATIAFIIFAGLHAFIALTGRETELTFVLTQAGVMASFALATSNFNAIAMEPLGAIAGSASSLQGFITTLGGALLGVLVGQSYDQSTTPLAVGFFVFGLMALLIVYGAESGHLFARPGRLNTATTP